MAEPSTTSTTDQAPAVCPPGCGGRGMHCPEIDPLEPILTGRQRDGWIAYWDEAEAHLAFETCCDACRGRLSYVALTPPAEGSHATAWAFCAACRHWFVL
jgi:hypothetical protein